jgi:hypothetical protein
MQQNRFPQMKVKPPQYFATAMTANDPTQQNRTSFWPGWRRNGTNAAIIRWQSRECFALGFLSRLLRVARLQLFHAAWPQLGKVRPETGLPSLAFLDILTELFEIGAARFLQLDLGIGGDAEQGASCKRGKDSESVHRFFLLYPRVIFIFKSHLDFRHYNPFRRDCDLCIDMRNPHPSGRPPSCVEPS